jgi:hypothetical protein
VKLLSHGKRAIKRLLDDRDFMFRMRRRAFNHQRMHRHPATMKPARRGKLKGN